MTPKRRANLLRLLEPRHVAVIGGRDAETVAGECARIGFDGHFWPINPKRSEIGSHACYDCIKQLPEPPDAVFLAIPREAAIKTLAELNSIGAGGVVCYTAGFGEVGEDGAAAELRLIEATGDLALLGPNCYGLINYVDRVALWPFAHGGRCPGYGAAIITQSGMLSSDLTMSQRSVPFAYMVSVGNQSILQLEDFVDVLCERDEVRAIGLHIEGLKDVLRFEEVALKALERDVPIVALKTGTSQIGGQLTVSHTGSLSGTTELYEALFDRLGIIRVTSPTQLLETLKFLCVAGRPKGRRVAGLTCSGGGATLLADHAEHIGLEFPEPSPKTVEALRKHLPHTATVSNPLDYTTPIWGISEKTAPVFKTFLADNYNAAVFVQDYPPPGLDESKQHYLNDAQSFVSAAVEKALPSAVCSTLPENLDAETREFLLSNQVAPMQGIHECLEALAGAAWCGKRWSEIRCRYPSALRAAPDVLGRVSTLDEAAAKTVLARIGIPVPHGRVVTTQDARRTSLDLGFPLALKMLSPKLPHKTEAGAVALGMTSPDEISMTIRQMRNRVLSYDADAISDDFLLETMVGEPIAEVLVNVRRDPQFGYAMTLASGGVLAEVIDDATTLLLPTPRSEIERALQRLRVSRLFEGYRGKATGDRIAFIDTLERLAQYVCTSGDELIEVEINPMFIMHDNVCAIDVFMRVANSPEHSEISGA